MTTLARRLGVRDAVVVGLGAMVGAGVFSALAPAARAAGAWLLAGLALAAVVAYCNATSSARLAALYPESGGTYVYAGRRLGPLWGVAAGWAFVLGKLASCAAMAITFAVYAAPDHQRVAAVAAVVAVTAVDALGIERSALVTRVLVAFVLLVLAVVVVASLAAGDPSVSRLGGTGGSPAVGPRGVLEAAGLLFFAFAGYARIATLGEEVRDPRRTIPRAITVALAIALAVYTAVAVTGLLVAGPAGLGATDSPLRAVVDAAGLGELGPVVVAGAVVASLGSLLSLVLGVTRTVFAMARDHRLPGALAAVHTRRRTPHRATLLIGAVVAVLAATFDLRGAIGFSSFAVLLYYALANAAAFTLTDAEGRPPRAVPVAGLLGCVVLSLSVVLG